jgi:hypothetical protein
MTKYLSPAGVNVYLTAYASKLLARLLAQATPKVVTMSSPKVPASKSSAS